MSQRRLLLALAACALACEQGITLRGEVAVPRALQERFSDEQPGLLVMGGRVADRALSAQVLAVICTAVDDPLRVPFVHDQRGCAAEGQVWWKVVPVAKPDRAKLSCGVRQESFDALLSQGRVNALERQTALADATAAIFKGRKSDRCRSGVEELNVSLTASPVTPP